MRHTEQEGRGEGEGCFVLFFVFDFLLSFFVCVCVSPPRENVESYSIPFRFLVQGGRGVTLGVFVSFLDACYDREVHHFFFL